MFDGTCACIKNIFCSCKKKCFPPSSAHSLSLIETESLTALSYLSSKAERLSLLKRLEFSIYSESNFWIRVYLLSYLVLGITGIQSHQYAPSSESNRNLAEQAVKVEQLENFLLSRQIAIFFPKTSYLWCEQISLSFRNTYQVMAPTFWLTNSSHDVYWQIDMRCKQKHKGLWSNSEHLPFLAAPLRKPVFRRGSRCQGFHHRNTKERA